MATKQVTLRDGSKRTFGRKFTAEKRTKLPRFRDYLKAGYTPPASRDWVSKVAAWPIDLNNTLGDCVIAGIAHLINLWTTWFYGQTTQFTDADITKMYSAIGGYVPGDPNTDNGCNINPTALDYLVSPGFTAGENYTGPTHTAIGRLEIDGTNPLEVKQSIDLTGVVLIGFGFPDAWINAWKGDGSDVWDVGPGVSPDLNNGHCIIFGAYDSNGVEAINWGAKVKITWAAVALILNPANQGEAYAIVSNDWVAIGRPAPNGLDLATLIADTNAINNGSIPTPGVTPVSPVNPTPVNPPVNPTPVNPPEPAPTYVTGQIDLTGTLAEGLLHRGGTLQLAGTLKLPTQPGDVSPLDPTQESHTFDLADYSTDSGDQGRMVTMLTKAANQTRVNISVAGSKVTISKGPATNLNWILYLQIAVQILSILAAVGVL